MITYNKTTAASVVFTFLDAISKIYCAAEFVEGNQFDYQYFDKFNITIKLTFETASF